MDEIAATIGMLRATPATIRALMEGLSNELVRAHYGPETFSPFGILGHLILGERIDWLPRIRITLEHWGASNLRAGDDSPAGEHLGRARREPHRADLQGGQRPVPRGDRALATACELDSRLDCRGA